MKKTIWLIIALVVVIAIIILSSGKNKDSGPIKIGVLAPLTGDAAAYGEPARNIFNIAVSEINAAGGINGRPIELVIEDSQCNGKLGPSAAQKLVNVDKVQVILGDLCSGATLAELPVAEAGKVVLFSGGASSPDLTGKSPYFVRNYPSDASQGTVVADAAYKLGYRKVAFVQEQTDYALGVFKAFSTQFEKLGGTIVKEEFPTQNTDFRSILVKLQAQKPDALFIDTQTSAVTGRLLPQLAGLKWKPKIILNDVSIGTPELLAQNKDLLEGAIGAEFVKSGNEKFNKLLADYKAKHGADMPFQPYGQTEYDSVYMVRDAITAVGNDGTKVAQWLRTVKDWPGASGSVTIDPVTGDRLGGHALEIVKDGKAVSAQ